MMLKPEFIPNKEFMRKAIELAISCKDSDDVPVGAVVELNGKIIGVGKNRREGAQLATAHAEIEAIENACKNLNSWRLKGANLYVTLEPCPMCAGACINARIDRIIFGAFEEKSGALGSCVDLTKIKNMYKPKIYPGFMEIECKKILTEFFNKLR